MHAIQKYDPLLSLIFLKYSVRIPKFIETSVKYGGKHFTKAVQNRFSRLFESPFFLYIGLSKQNLGI